MDLETGNSKGQDAKDAQLEADIASAYTCFIGAKTPAARRKAFEDARRLQAQRSPEQIHKMEQRAGLAAGAGSPPR